MPATCEPAGLREARRALAEGRALTTSALPSWLQASWQRSRDFGLAPSGSASGVPHASAAQLARMLESRQQLVSHARPVMEFVGEQIRGSDSLVILAAPCGVLLCSLGDDSFAHRAARVALRPGANWHEQWRGTNAIGTVIASGQPTAVLGHQHYLERNGFLCCSAAPIFDSAGRLLGVLDISGNRSRHHPHSLGLARSAARLIEHRLFEVQHGGDLQLGLHASAAGIGTMTEGLLAVSEDGRIIGADPLALSLLGLDGQAIGHVRADEALGLPLSALAGAADGAAPVALQPPQRAGGGLVFGGIHRGRRMAGRSFVPASPALVRPLPADALAALDLGDPALAAAVARARKLVDKPIPLLVLGESGVGKEVFARACHASSQRAAQPFVAVNCAALPEHLIESELFGYRPGAFTGASREGRIGRIREAHRGTLFLDEIGDMPLALQTHLLRVLQERQVVPLGGGAPVAVDFQLICATHRDLLQEVEAGRFRRDLYYRINGLTLRLPALRDRQDLDALIGLMLQTHAPGRALTLQPQAAQLLHGHRWPGNLRQLDNVLRAAVALLDDGESIISLAQLPDELVEVRAECLPAPPADDEDDADEANLRTSVERRMQRTLQECGGNMAEAARRLGVNRSTLYRRLRG